MTHPRAKQMPDFPLILTVGTLLCISMISIYSASSIVALKKFGTSDYFIKRWIIFVIISFTISLIFAHFNYHSLKKMAIIIMGMVSVALVAVLIPNIGAEINGSRRWIRLAGFMIQPSEYAKLAMIIFLAWYLDMQKDNMENILDGFIKPLGVPAALTVMILLQPDLGTSIDIILLSFVMLFVAGTPIRNLFYSIVGTIPAIIVLIKLYPWRLARIKAFIDPWSDPQRSGYQIIQSWIAIGSGGLAGKGPGESVLKLGYLPEPHTDFIFAIIGEEAGFVGTIVVLILFLILAYRGIKIATRTQDRFGKLLAFGLISMIVVQAFINISVVTGTLPTTGIPLPFISYGGSSLMVNMIGIGILLNISRQN